jgi:hypothetical protein
VVYLLLLELAKLYGSVNVSTEAVSLSSYFSTSQFCDRVWIKSGLFLASSLYTRHVLAIRLAPPSNAVCRQNNDTMSPVSVWKTCLSVV